MKFVSEFCDNGDLSVLELLIIVFCDEPGIEGRTYKQGYICTVWCTLYI